MVYIDAPLSLILDRVQWTEDDSFNTSSPLWQLSNRIGEASMGKVTDFLSVLIWKERHHGLNWVKFTGDLSWDQIDSRNRRKPKYSYDELITWSEVVLKILGVYIVKHRSDSLSVDHQYFPFLSSLREWCQHYCRHTIYVHFEESFTPTGPPSILPSGSLYNEFVHWCWSVQEWWEKQSY